MFRMEQLASGIAWIISFFVCARRCYTCFARLIQKIGRYFFQYEYCTRSREDCHHSPVSLVDHPRLQESSEENTGVMWGYPPAQLTPLASGPNLINPLSSVALEQTPNPLAFFSDTKLKSPKMNYTLF